MNEPDKNTSEHVEPAASQDIPCAPHAKASLAPSESRHWWIKLLVQPLLLLAAGTALLAGIGLAQRLGWISAGGGTVTHVASSGGEATRYICPMMCTPPQAEPGRCPVCAMELVPASAGGAQTDSHSVQIDPAARRLANIQTAAVKHAPVERTIRAVGKLSYDEGSLKTISAYVDGRLDRLYADYTGVVVERGDHLALLYSPRLYSAQVEYLLSKKARDESQSATLQRVVDTSQDLYRSARQRLIELGVTGEQIDQLEQAGEANSRMHICAPISGTVIEKLAVEGQYVKEGQAVYHLADLSTVWLLLDLFPEDAALIRNGQQVEAEVHSLPGRKFSGHVAFIDPTVDSEKRTVGVRVVVPNDDGTLRVGDYAKATIRTPLSSMNKSLVVPRSAVLMNGGHSLVYVESEPGRFEIRPVILGASCGDQVVVLEGLKEGEQVATSGNFLIDSQMQLAGNPSLINPSKAQPKPDDGLSPEVIAALSELSDEDRVLAERQRVCPVTMYPLGSMGTPPKVEVKGQIVFLCCEGCREALLEDPEKYLELLAAGPVPEAAQDDLPQIDIPPIGEMTLVLPSSAGPQSSGQPTDQSELPEITAAMFELSNDDRRLAEKQRVCPVTGMQLGSMGTPIKVIVHGRTVFLCCESCRETLLAEPTKYLAKLDQEAVR